MNCKNCKKQGCSLAGKDHEMSFECKAYIGNTNADRIRAMTDEELAEFMNHGACPPGKDVSELCSDEDGGSVPDMCNLCWLDWLKEEAKE